MSENNTLESVTPVSVSIGWANVILIGSVVVIACLNYMDSGFTPALFGNVIVGILSIMAVNSVFAHLDPGKAERKIEPLSNALTTYKLCLNHLAGSVEDEELGKSTELFIELFSACTDNKEIRLAIAGLSDKMVRAIQEKLTARKDREQLRSTDEGLSNFERQTALKHLSNLRYVLKVISQKEMS